jgi:3-phosphoshikimate 1-carboxyvinyltransferase
MSNTLRSPLPINPVSNPLSASVRVPGSKSLTNRVLLVAALADGTTRLTNALFSDDTLYFAESLNRLGFTVQLEPGSDKPCFTPLLDSGSLVTSLPSMTVTGVKGRIPAPRADLYVGNAGTAARFLLAVLTLGQCRDGNECRYTIDGDARMRQRPMRDLFAVLEQLGALITRPQSPDHLPMGDLLGDSLPVTVHARGLSGGHVNIAGDASSQFLSGLLMVAPYARGAVELEVVRGLNSKPFVDMTLAVMADFGVNVERDGYDRFLIRPQRYLSPGTYAIECDATAASYFFAAAAICGGAVRVEGITRPAKQGDLAFLDVLYQMGCSVEDGSDWVSVTGLQESPCYSSLRGVSVDMCDISDTAQTLAVVAPFASTPTTIRGIASTRLKETDRVSAICTELTRLGVRVEEHADGLTIYPCQNFHPAEIHTYRDHRMAMAFSLIGLKVPGLKILDPECVSKTFPGYFDVLARLQT